MDDIYDWSSKFAERVDDLEEVKFSNNSSVTCTVYGVKCFCLVL